MRATARSPNISEAGKGAMPEQFVVPQFLDVEDKILGPITARQFIILIVTFLVAAIMYRLLAFGYFIFFGILVIAAGAVIAFVRINGQPFHYFLLNLVQTLRRPPLRVWNKQLFAAELKELMNIAPAPPPPPKPVKEKLAASRINELTLILNTGGAYNPEQYK
ncbi:PrgI family protein [Candidatus Uhrbacteria bacterium]|nr:PrgI family protein [Candidatus Uhrbacteria bacterium]